MSAGQCRQEELHQILKYVITHCPSVASRTKVVSGTPFFELLPLKEVPTSDGGVLVHDVGRLLASWHKESVRKYATRDLPNDELDLLDGNVV